MSAIVGFAQDKINRGLDSLKSHTAKEGERLVTGYAVYGAGQKLRPFQYVAPELKDGEVEVKIEYCGVCHSDIQMIKNEMMSSKYPFIPGHEIIGRITELGPNVDSKYKVGQVVGVGWERTSCHKCDRCNNRMDHMCSEQQGTIQNGNHGGYADYIRIDSKWTFPVPDGMNLQEIPPLLCAGITVYNPLKRFGCEKGGMKIGLIGMGGLGHLFVQMAKAMGNEVVVFSTHEDKEKESLEEFKADDFIAYENALKPTGLDKYEEKLDFILCTAYAQINWLAFGNLLKPHGTFCLVGLPPSSVIPIPIPMILEMERQVVASKCGCSEDTQEMLEFCAKNKIAAKIEQIYPLDGAQDALDKFESEGFYYRAVLSNGSVSGESQTVQQ